MTDYPMFSVLIANYNNGRFLQSAIDSVLAQTYSNWEIILVDDRSTDNSFAIYEKYKDDCRFHIYKNSENKGCGYTKRRCSEMAKGELCGFLDPDDTLENDALEIMVNCHMANANVSLVYSRYYISDNQLNVLGISKHQCVLPENQSFLEYGKGAISAFATYKKKDYDRTEGINPTYKRAVDHALYFLLEEVGEVLFVDKPLYYYRMNTGDNISTNSNSDAAFLWDIVVAMDACRRRGVDVERITLDMLKNYIADQKNISYLQGMECVRNTKRYKLGKTILLPFQKRKD